MNSGSRDTVMAGLAPAIHVFLKLAKYGLPIVAIAAAALAAIAALAGPADAARARPETKWCLRGPTGGQACNFNTLEQCRKTAHGAGGACMRNPRFGR